MQNVLKATSVALWCIFWLLSGTSHANNVNALRADQSVLTPVIDYFEDTAGDMTLATLLARESTLDWQRTQYESLNKGYNQNPFWIRLQMTNRDAQPVQKMLEIAYPQLDHVTFYLLDQSRIVSEVHTGDAWPFFERPIDSPNFVFPLEVPGQATQTLYIRLQTTGTMSAPMALWSPNAFFIHTGKIEQIHAIYYGILTVVIIFNLFVFVALRESTYLYYSLSTLGYLILLAVLRGKTFQVFWPTLPELHRLTMLMSIPFVLLFSVLFARSFLNLKKSSPKMDKLFQLISVLACVSMPGTLVLPYQYSVQTSVLLAIPTCSLLLIIGPIEWAKGNRPARFYSMAWAMLTFGATIAAMNKAGLLPNNVITEYGIQFGSAMEAILLCIALAERIYEEREGKLKAQAETIREHNERRNAELMVIRQALLHPITQLPNYTHFEMFVNDLIKQHPDKPFSIGIIHLANFHEINKTLGHNNADKLLVQLARKYNTLAELAPGIHLVDNDGERESYICSLEESSFGVVIDTSAWYNHQGSLKNMLGQLSLPMEFLDMQLDLTPHIGTANFPDDGHDANTLIRRAQVALEHASLYDLHLAFYRPQQDPYNAKRLTLITELKRSIQEDLLELYYQPKISLVTHQVIGVEALLRWNHPGFGMIPTEEFVSVAEQTGIIKSLTRWVLRKAFSQLTQLNGLGYSLSMSINVSTKNLRESDFSDFIASLFESFQTLPEQVTLELTETAMMSDPVKARDALLSIYRTGVRIAIDDFGTGYSSLSYIKRVPANEIKIDKSLILELDKNPDDAVIVKTTIDMCQNLGFTVVAEGAENQAVVDKLAEMACDVVQGYHFARPLPFNELKAWLETQNTPKLMYHDSPSSR